jgi:hypothetical protein
MDTDGTVTLKNQGNWFLDKVPEPDGTFRFLVFYKNDLWFGSDDQREAVAYYNKAIKRK